MRPAALMKGRRAGVFVVSLDFELYWGMRDQMPLAAYRDNLLGVRRAIPAILETFEEFGIRGTWATVGFLFYDSKKELLAGIPSRRPQYADPAFDAYAAIDGIGEDETSDPFHYARSLVERIVATPGQEVASHTFSHYYCLEPGQSIDDFRADLIAAKRAADRLGVKLRSLVFPRNQVKPEYLKVCAELGFVAYRGTERSWIYDAVALGEQTPMRRGLRLMDAYAPLAGHCTHELISEFESSIVNVPSSRFLRPYTPLLAMLEPVRLRRITKALEHAAKASTVYHLWWHPHNFGAHLERNLRMLRSVLEHFTSLRQRFGMESLSMAEVATRALAPQKSHDPETNRAVGGPR